MTKRKNIVVLCGQYYPDAGAPVSCFFPYINELSKNNQVIVVCRKTSSVPVSEYKGTISFRQLTVWYNSLRYYLQDKIKAGQNVGINTFLLNLVRVYSSLRTMFCYPTQHSWIIRKYTQTLITLEKELGSIDAIISISFPFCSHIAALNYKKSHPSIKWITYSTDPFTLNECQYERVAFKSHKRRWAQKKEKEIYDNADANIVTNELYSMLINTFNQHKEKTIAFPYLITSILHANSSAFVSRTIINCVYAGSLYSDIRNPKVMVSIFESVGPNIHLTLYADGDLKIREFLKGIHSDRVEVRGLVDRKEYERIITEEADILINIGNTTTLQSPSKLLELVSTGRPIVNFYSHKDFGYEVIERYPLGLNVPNEGFSKEQVSVLDEFCTNNNGKILEFETIKNLYPNHIKENHMKILNELLG